ncbi:type I secretion system permease/ATPase [Chlorobium phaeobacteroides]|jgi:ATP-binding cassette subfamily C exporter for protease/lipase|uniref:Type I secretion system ATPase n=1 Tax=Chlorobium phaeobacteroides (strain DSM 266 / SMG 266 / 2430) TaxID=290317 RepID=A1BH89_CHLPD|nr:type I secretion system permease/ATPase [Chlorobium phaeobacteroides]ABL65766.1 type I secretion system ATPase [Chlorobium phaeobacteroides DSM 266]
MSEAIASLYPSFTNTFFFSLIVNVLVLAPSAYMMEVYDRVVNSRSHTTLLMLTILVIGSYLLLEALEWVRRQVMHGAGLGLDAKLRDQVIGAMFTARLQSLSSGGTQALRDLKTVCDFLASTAMLAIIDMPLALLVLVLIFMMSPMLGWFAVAGALMQFMIGVINERRIREPLLAANRGSRNTQAYADSVLRNAEVIESMGMLDHIHNRWMRRQQDFLVQQAKASDHAGTNAALSKLVQSLLGSLLLGVGCWLTLKGELQGSGMIVSSILGGRVLSPLVQIIGNWRQVEGAFEAFTRLDLMLKQYPVPEKRMALPPPTGSLVVDNLIAGAPGSKSQILKGISFRLAPGGTLAIVGPSASGKTTLARLLVGIWPAIQGKVRLDGNDIYQWDKEELGQYIGYLPQNVELFDGTIAENIARFGEPDEAKVEAACRMVGLERFIEQLPQGYDTRIGDDGSFLSGGERQRVALARSVYGMPKFIVLDEPNASLDEAGDAALLRALQLLKTLGTTIIVITHRLNILGATEHMLVLVDGQVQRFGTSEEVLAALQSSQDARPASNGKP